MSESKYMPLWQYIAKENVCRITFDEVEKLLGFPIDHSFLNHKKELKEYGYEVKKISMTNKDIIVKKIILTNK